MHELSYYPVERARIAAEPPPAMAPRLGVGSPDAALRSDVAEFSTHSVRSSKTKSHDSVAKEAVILMEALNQATDIQNANNEPPDNAILASLNRSQLALARKERFKANPWVAESPQRIREIVEKSRNDRRRLLELSPKLWFFGPVTVTFAKQVAEENAKLRSAAKFEKALAPSKHVKDLADLAQEALSLVSQPPQNSVALKKTPATKDQEAIIHKKALDLEAKVADEERELKKLGIKLIGHKEMANNYVQNVSPLDLTQEYADLARNHGLLPKFSNITALIAEVADYEERDAIGPELPPDIKRVLQGHDPKDVAVAPLGGTTFRWNASTTSPEVLPRGDVAKLQKTLATMGYALDVTGYFDEATGKAVVSFKMANSLHQSYRVEDGRWAINEVVDKATAALLEKLAQGQLRAER